MRLYAVFAGTVQGVGFRYFVRDKAKKLGVKGYVRIYLTEQLRW
ncbi:MAG: acylphosphatase [Persephonella sp.]|nr:acylphosphatase [Persephonella sp.]